IQRQPLPAALTEDTKHSLGVLHFAYLSVSGVRSPVPLRPAGGFPASLGRSLLLRLLWELRRHRTRVPWAIPRSSSSYVIARLRRPTHLLQYPHWTSLRIRRVHRPE